MKVALTHEGCATPKMQAMKQLVVNGWALQRPTGELMLMFVRQAKAEVIASVAEHFPGQQFRQQWRTMKRNGFKVVRIEIRMTGC